VATTVLSKTPAPAGRSDAPSSTGALQPGNAAPNFRNATDDEILNLSPRALAKKKPAAEPVEERAPENSSASADAMANVAPPVATRAPVAEELRVALDDHPELRAAWEDAAAYRESFTSPEQAREATRLVGDLNRLDALFFSSRPEDHAELAKVVAQLDPSAAASLARELAQLATEAQRKREGNEPHHGARLADHESQPSVTPAQTEFFHAANAAAVEGVLDAIHAQVDRLLPDGTSQAARNRVVGEIYRELDVSLRSNRQLGAQLQQAFKSGSLDAAHQRAIVSLITSRARQALPGVAKRVMNEWTSALVSAGEERRSRQRAAESRVDIGGSGRSGADSRRTLSPREIDYSRLSDADILNL